MIPEIKAVFFDLDGTLLDRDTSLKRFIADQYDRYQQEFSQVDKQQYISTFIDYDCRGYVWKDKVYRQLLKEFSLANLTWEKLLEDYIVNFQTFCTPFRNVRKVLDTLRSNGVRLGLISNGKKQFQRANLHALGIQQHFDSILISGEIGIRKPDPAIFELGMQQLSVAPENSVYVGDHPENDVKASREAGMIGIWKRDSYWKEAEADFIIEDLEELIEIVLKGAAENGRF